MTGLIRWCAAACLLLALTPLAASAQLGITQYGEFATITVGGFSDTVAGPNLHLGDDVTATVPGGSASVGFEMPASPDWMTASARIETASSSANAQANGTIDFKFTLNQLQNPPIAITAVPMRVTASGYVDAARSGFEVTVDARAEFVLTGETETLVSLAANTNVATGIFDDAFSETVAFQVTPTEVVSAAMWAQVTISAFSEGAQVTGSGNAYIDPVFVVSDDLIPGTSTRYDEVYEVEFSSGWDDSTGGVPISGTQSVGKLKANFGH